ncbi:MAG: hypothetical protein L3J52_05355, partial [Proteobacteria bacterium]|nr:hypothetical protein [Pseudomonadota bacterium]
FRLAPEKFVEFCTTGPFYAGGKVELVLRSFVPIFSCLTRFDKEIIIIGSKRVDGSYETKALCH